MNYKEFVMTEMNCEYTFTKPLCICKELNEWEKSILMLNKMDFAKAYKEKIQTEINAMGLRFRIAVLEDIDPIIDFFITRFTHDLDAISKYDLFRFIEYGHGLILENEQRLIVGCLFEIGYKKVQMKISYSIRLGIDESVRGKGLGRLLTVYSCLLAMEKGSQVKRALILSTNFLSLHLNVNQLGWLIDTFHHNLGLLGLCFESSLPLTPEALLLNRIDLDKVQMYIAEHQEGIDYLLIKSNDIETIISVYKNRMFKIAAIINQEQDEDKPVFFALPVEMLYAK